MDAQKGINFLVQLLCDSRFPMDTEDMEEAIKIAGENNPSGAFKKAGKYYCLCYGRLIADGYLAFQKGTRWLAVIWRDEGDRAFEKVCDELRGLL